MVTLPWQPCECSLPPSLPLVSPSVGAAGRRGRDRAETRSSNLNRSPTRAPRSRSTAHRQRPHTQPALPSAPLCQLAPLESLLDFLRRPNRWRRLQELRASRGQQLWRHLEWNRQEHDLGGGVVGYLLVLEHGWGKGHTTVGVGTFCGEAGPVG